MLVGPSYPSLSPPRTALSRTSIARESPQFPTTMWSLVMKAVMAKAAGRSEGKAVNAEVQKQLG